MAEETKAQTKSTNKSDKKKAPEAGADAAQPAEHSCLAGKCKQPVRAKGYCRKHFLGWRRGELGKKHRYKICSKEGCRKPRALGGMCEEHSGKGAPAAEAAG